jgi:hypothetical protein
VAGPRPNADEIGLRLIHSTGRSQSADGIGTLQSLEIRAGACKLPKPTRPRPRASNRIVGWTPTDHPTDPSRLIFGERVLDRSCTRRLGRQTFRSDQARQSARPSSGSPPHARGDDEADSRLKRRRAGSPPRVWGRLESAHILDGPLRCNPTRVGTTGPYTVQSTFRAIHPHALRCLAEMTQQGLFEVDLAGNRIGETGCQASSPASGGCVAGRKDHGRAVSSTPQACRGCFPIIPAGGELLAARRLNGLSG